MATFSKQLPKMATDFTLFPEFPIEVRLKIWKAVCFIPRDIDVRVKELQPQTYDDEQTGVQSVLLPHIYCTKSQVPSVLHVNQEARSEAQRFYTLEFGIDFPEANWMADPKIYINYEVDTILFFDVVSFITSRTADEWERIEQTTLLIMWLIKLGVTQIGFELLPLSSQGTFVAGLIDERVAIMLGTIGPVVKIGLFQELKDMQKESRVKGCFLREQCFRMHCEIKYSLLVDLVAASKAIDPDMSDDAREKAYEKIMWEIVEMTPDLQYGFRVQGGLEQVKWSPEHKRSSLRR